MGQRCGICKHDNRLEIDRAIVRGVPYLRIGKKYGVNDVSVANHAKKHLSRQMLQHQETRDLLHSDNLLKEIASLLDKSKEILDKAESKGKLKLSLSAIGQARSTVELLCKLSAHLNQGQQNENRELEEYRRKEIEKYKEGFRRLSKNEIKMYAKLINKISSVRNSDDIMDVDSTSLHDYSPPVRRKKRFKRKKKEKK